MNQVRPSAEPRGGARLKVLVVDDDALSGSLQTHLTQLLGHDASAETDAAQALDRALSDHFDLMLLDLNMPGLDGFSALRNLRYAEQESGRDRLPVIAVTGFAGEHERDRCLAAGFDEHLTKPVYLVQLQEAIERVLGRASALAADGGSAAQTDADRLRATVNRLQQMKPNDHAFAPTVVESFALRSAQLIESLRQAVAAREANRGERAALALRSSAQFLGAHDLATAAEFLNQALLGADWEQATDLLRHVEQRQQAVLTVLFEARQ